MAWTCLYSLVVESQLDANEVKQLLAKGTAERDRLDVERVSTQIDMKSWPGSPARFSAVPDDSGLRFMGRQVEGLGAAPAARHEHIERKSVVEREIERMVGAHHHPR